MINPVSSDFMPLVVVYDKATGQRCRFGTSNIVLDMAEDEAVLDVPFGVAPLGKVVDLATMTLVDLPAEVTQAFEQDRQWARVRQQRDALLAASDYLLMPDYPITAEQRAQVEAYRKALRDLTEQADPTKIVWPSPWNMSADTTSA